jgi:UDP-N-acetylglucosamine acyltransferase
MDREIKKSNQISSSCYIGPNVKLGRDNVLERNVCIYGDVEIGNNNYISSGVIIGGFSRQMKKPKIWDPKPKDYTKISLGDDNMICEYVTIRKPMMGETTIQDGVSIGAHSHVGHDVKICSGVIIGVNVSIAGYVILRELCNIGMGACIHQRSVIGEYAMCGMGAIVKGYVFPGIIVSGIPAEYMKVNEEGLRRNGFSDNEINAFILAISNKKYSDVFLEKKINDFLDDCKKWRRDRDKFEFINVI